MGTPRNPWKNLPSSSTFDFYPLKKEGCNSDTFFALIRDYTQSVHQTVFILKMDEIFVNQLPKAWLGSSSQPKSNGWLKKGRLGRQAGTDNILLTRHFRGHGLCHETSCKLRRRCSSIAEPEQSKLLSQFSLIFNPVFESTCCCTMQCR